MPATERMLGIGTPEQQGRQQPQGCQKQHTVSAPTTARKQGKKWQQEHQHKQGRQQQQVIFRS
jgi:hypothetical protein